MIQLGCLRVMLVGAENKLIMVPLMLSLIFCGENGGPACGLSRRFSLRGIL